jgi:hypothetical protein
LYHFGHFALKFRTHCGALLDHGGFAVLAEASDAGDARRAVVDVAVQPRGAPGGATAPPRRWRFSQLRGDAGSFADCWLTEAITELDA